jgi:hypothetical protein
LFNEESKYCVIPKKYRNFKHLLDLDKDGEVSQDEINKATKILEKARKKDQKKEHLKNLNSFMLRV